MSKVTFTVNSEQNLNLLLLLAEALGLETVTQEDDVSLNGQDNNKRESTLRTIREQIKKAKDDLEKDF